MNRKNLDTLITDMLAIEAEDAKQAGAVGYMARALTQATLPHRAIPGNEFIRQNGYFTLSILAPSSVGVPYGTYPRLLLAWLTTEAVRTRCPVLALGSTLSGFMMELGLIPAGGRWGTIHRLRDQMNRLFASSVSCVYADELQDAGAGFRITNEYKLWWSPKAPDQIPLWKSTVTLSTDFFEEIVERPIPIDMRALRALKRSPLALDIYCWLTYRMSYLRKPTVIPWGVLQMQFGSDYAHTRQFKAAFLKHLKAVLLIYPEARVAEAERGLQLRPSPPHIAQQPMARIQAPTLPRPVSAPLLKTKTYEDAKVAAPGWDIYALEYEWRDWIADKEPPKNPDAAFIGFCRQKHQKG